jgi:outer membrane protein assembly factor BamA
MNLKNNYNNRKKNAVSRGLEFTINALTLSSILRANRCQYLNVPLNVKRVQFKGLTKVTVDRIDSSLGYVNGNCCAASNIANQLKNLVESGLIVPQDIINFGHKLKKI